MTWHHPSYYKKLRAERNKVPVSGTPNRETGSADNDQAASVKRQAASDKLLHL